MPREYRPRPCSCGSGQMDHEVYDAQSIYIGRMCGQCKRERLSHFRPEILRGYSQADVNEPIEPEDA